MTDIEIASATQMLEISEVAKKLGLSDIFFYQLPK